MENSKASKSLICGFSLDLFSLEIILAPHNFQNFQNHFLLNSGSLPGFILIMELIPCMFACNLRSSAGIQTIDLLEEFIAYSVSTIYAIITGSTIYAIIIISKIYAVIKEGTISYSSFVKVIIINASTT